MLKIGIVGAENSHCREIAAVCNVLKKVPARVVTVWGEKPKYARDAAAFANIPEVVTDWRNMLGKVDGIMIDHRHPKYHAEVAAFYVKHGIPCFIDKPFTFTLAEGKRLCALAGRKKVPITTFSVLPVQKNFRDFQKAVAGLDGEVTALNTSGPVDLKSKYGGVFFYGFHQVDAIIELLGTAVESVTLKKIGGNGIAVIAYRNGAMVTMNCIKGNGNFHWTAFGATTYVDWRQKFDDLPYLTGAKTFIKMFKTGKEPIPHQRMLAPVAVLEAMAKSLKTGKTVKVARF